MPLQTAPGRRPAGPGKRQVVALGAINALMPTTKRLVPLPAEGLPREEAGAVGTATAAMPAGVAEAMGVGVVEDAAIIGRPHPAGTARRSRASFLRAQVSATSKIPVARISTSEHVGTSNPAAAKRTNVPLRTSSSRSKDLHPPLQYKGRRKPTGQEEVIAVERVASRPKVMGPADRAGSLSLYASQREAGRLQQLPGWQEVSPSRPKRPRGQRTPLSRGRAHCVTRSPEP